MERRTGFAAEPGDYCAIGLEPLDLAELCGRVAGPSFGAIATFSGTVRDEFEGRPVRGLEYEAYRPMALDVLRRIASELRERHAIGRVAIAHRVGGLDVGETSVIVAVSAPHRQAALQACAEAIERLKATLPIWKKELFEGGEVWRENVASPRPTPEQAEPSSSDPGVQLHDPTA